MSKVFFPGSNPAVQALSIWGIFAGQHASSPQLLQPARHHYVAASQRHQRCQGTVHITNTKRCLSACLPTCLSVLCLTPTTVGFVSRPVGALIFGHMGDTRGRGLCLLISVILMGVPTVSQTLF
jgi:hypothetical protein